MLRFPPRWGGEGRGGEGRGEREVYPFVFIYISLGQPGKHCQADASLSLNDSNQENCQKLQNTTLRRYLVHCTPFITGYSYPKCSSYCRLFSQCFDVAETPRWIKRCSKKFRTLSQRFMIATTGGIRKISIKPRRPFWKGLFIIKIDRCNCSASQEDYGTYIDRSFNNSLEFPLFSVGPSLI